jgi:hypothetical protein
MRAHGVAVLVSMLIATSGVAHAQNLAAAEALFEEGKRLMDAGRFSEACPKFEESQRLDPGTGTLWHLANCYEKTDRLASAWAKYRQVAQETRRRGEFQKAQAAMDAAKNLEPRLRRIAIDVPPKHAVSGIVIRRDGERVGQGAWSTAVPVDRGRHLVTAEAPGYAPWQQEVVIEDEMLTRVRVPSLTKLPGSRHRDTSHWYEDWVGWTVLGSGLAVAGAGTGAYFYGKDVENDARLPGLPIERREHDLRRARDWKLGGTIAWIIGGAAAVAGGVKLSMHPRGESSSGVEVGLSVQPGGLVLGLEQSF